MASQGEFLTKIFCRTREETAMQLSREGFCSALPRVCGGLQISSSFLKTEFVEGTLQTLVKQFQFCNVIQKASNVIQVWLTSNKFSDSTVLDFTVERFDS